ncbi:MAG: acyltransferase [Xanthobacteraceae bacterium]|nr:acyltransferase [Xanthobacteraceae bacterium]
METSRSRLDRVPQLDGLRGIAVSLVVLYHYGVYYVDGSGLFPPLRWLAVRGWVGVDLFFVMSGFLIGGIVIANRDADNLFSTFYARRFLRIFPLYYLLLGTSAIYLWTHPYSGMPSLLPYFFYFQNNTLAFTGDAGPTWLQPGWTLAVEEQFYLLLPAIVFLTPPRLLKYVVTAGILVALAMRVAGYLILPLENPKLFALFLTPCRFDDLFYGVLLALLVRSGAGPISRKAQILICYAGFVGGLLGFVFLYQTVPLLLTVGLTLLGAAFFSMVALTVLHERGPLALITGTRLLRWIGVRTYAIYLFHVPVLLGVRRFFDVTGADPHGSMQLVAVAVTLAVASASWRLIEAPLIGLGHRLKYGQGARHLVLRPGAPETTASAGEPLSETGQALQQGRPA